MRITHVPSSQLGGEGIMRLHHWSVSGVRLRALEKVREVSMSAQC